MLAKSGFDGKFKLDVPDTLQAVIIASVGMEWKMIRLSAGCNLLDVVLLNRVLCDFMSIKKEDRLRKQRFKKLHLLHQDAFQKGLFSTKFPCYKEKFIPSL